MQATPDSQRQLSSSFCQANQYPLAAVHQRQAPTSIEFSSSLSALLVALVKPGFSQFSLFPARPVSTSRFLNCDMSLTTLLSLTGAAVVRLLARSASYPCLFVGLRQCPLAATYPAPGSHTLCFASPQNSFLWSRRFSSSACLESRASLILLTSPELV